MVHLVCVVALVLLGVSAASAQDRGALAIDEAAGRYALSLDGEADAVNMCGTTGCKVVATFSSCLGVAHSSPTQGQAVWTWFEADTAVVARQEAFDECQRAGGPACAGLNVICLTDSGRRDSGAAAAAQLPPDIQADRYLRQAEQAVRDGDAASARAAMERLVSLEQEHGLEPSPEDHYRYAQAWEAAGAPQRALASAVRYLQLRGREAEHYTEALDLMNRAESGKVAAATGARGQAESSQGRRNRRGRRSKAGRLGSAPGRLAPGSRKGPRAGWSWPTSRNATSGIPTTSGRDRGMDWGVFRGHGPGDGNAHPGPGS